MTEKNKPGRKPRKVAESVNKKLTETLAESEDRRQGREDLLAKRALEEAVRREAREDAVAERRLAHDLRRMEATEAMFSRFAHNVVGIAREGVQAMMPVYEHIGSEATRDIILAQVESQKHAMALLTTVLVEGVPAAIRAYAEVRAVSTPAPVTHEEFKVWTDTLMGHVYARNDAHLDLLDATIRTSASSSFANTLGSLPHVKASLFSGDCGDDCEACDGDDDSDSSRGYGGVEGYTPSHDDLLRVLRNAKPVPSSDEGDILGKMINRPPSASRTGKAVIVSFDGFDIGFDQDFSDRMASAEDFAFSGSGDTADASISLYGDMGYGFGSNPLVEFEIEPGDDPLQAIAKPIRMLMPEGGDERFRVRMSRGEDVFLDTTFSVVCVRR